jgi:hypothetical protein
VRQERQELQRRATTATRDETGRQIFPGWAYARPKEVFQSAWTQKHVGSSEFGIRANGAEHERDGMKFRGDKMRTSMSMNRLKHVLQSGWDLNGISQFNSNSQPA